MHVSTHVEPGPGADRNKPSWKTGEEAVDEAATLIRLQMRTASNKQDLSEHLQSVTLTLTDDPKMRGGAIVFVEVVGTQKAATDPVLGKHEVGHRYTKECPFSTEYKSAKWSNKIADLAAEMTDGVMRRLGRPTRADRKHENGSRTPEHATA
ncbi:MAG TPA: hypothetical protein VHD37_00795 [Candidatus Paceibacterota bacterium]|nr:hypothetical protein [Candidatus Paceibacterota bacterium]